MGPLETQSEPDVQPAYFDPDAADVSEQQFAASLEAEIKRPNFVLDGMVELGPTTSDLTAETTRLCSADEPIEGDPAGANELPALQTDESPSAVEANVSPAVRNAESQSPVGASDLSPALQRWEKPESGLESRTDDRILDSENSHPDWRDQVSARVSHYKSRKSPKVRYPSLQLPFEAPAPRRQERPLGELESRVETALCEPAEQAVLRQAAAPPPVILESVARVIEFPRSAIPIPAADELAEPMLDRPRIVEAPAMVPPPPAMGGILIEVADEREPERQPGFDMPLRSAPLSRRLLAAGIDGLLVGFGLAVFGCIFLKLNASSPPLRPALEAAAILAAILWFFYQYTFLVFTGSTPGLRLAKLAVTHFDGTSVPRKARRWRVLASLLSGISLGLGYAWCFLDEDQLSWHDRITRTHLAPTNSPDHS